MITTAERDANPTPEPDPVRTGVGKRQRQTRIVRVADSFALRIGRGIVKSNRLLLVEKSGFFVAALLRKESTPCEIDVFRGTGFHR